MGTQIWGKMTFAILHQPLTQKNAANFRLSFENPKIGRIYDAEVIADGIGVGAPVFWNFVTQESENGVTEIVELGVTSIMGDVFMHEAP